MSRRKHRHSNSPVEEKALDSLTFPTDLLAAPTLSGASITPQTALTVPAVANAVALIAGACGTLPLYLYRDEGQGKLPAEDHPAYDLIAVDANDWTSSGALRQQIAIDAMLHGDGFALANRLPSGEIFELIRLDPRSVVVYYNPETSEPEYHWTPFSGGAATLGTVPQPNYGQDHREARVFNYRDVIHVRSPISVDGITGVSPIAYAREAIGLALTLEQYASRLFGRGARPSGLLKFPAKLSAESAARMKSSWQAAHGGSNSGGTAVLEQGGSWEPVTLNSVDAQFIEQRHAQVIEIARVFGISPVLIGDLSRATWSNSEEANRQFLQFTLLPWLRAFEGAYRRVVLSADERKTHCISFDTSDLLRGDTATRGEFIAKLRAAGVITANEARAFEDLPAHRDGDTLQNPFTSSAHANGNAPAPKDKAA